MSHVIVGERIAGMNPEMFGHVVRGAGHFVEQGNGLVQEFARHLPEIPYIVARSLPDLTDPATYENWQWNALVSNYGEGSLLAGNNESTAWDRYMEHPSTKQGFDVVLEAAKATGSLMAGDLQGTIEYGANATEKFVDKTLRDMGFKGGWSDWGPQPGLGTCPPGPNRD